MAVKKEDLDALDDAKRTLFNTDEVPHRVALRELISRVNGAE
jgi:hypothetical protein